MMDGVISPVLSSLYGASHFTELLCAILQLGVPPIYSDYGNPPHPLNSAAAMKSVWSIPCSNSIWRYLLSPCTCDSCLLLQPDKLLGVSLNPAHPTSCPTPPAPQGLVATLRTRVGTLFLHNPQGVNTLGFVDPQCGLCCILLLLCCLQPLKNVNSISSQGPFKNRPKAGFGPWP